MTQFRYRAVRQDGTVIEDRTDAESEWAVRTQLQSQGLLVLSLQGGQSGVSVSWPQLSSGRLSLREFLIFNQQFLALVKAGLAILRIFDILTERATHRGFQQALQEVRNNIRGGAAISEAMENQPKHFSELYRASIQSGEHTGNLIEVLQRYIGYLKLTISVREKVVKAFAYPAFLIIVGVCVVGFLLGYVMPTFAEVYAQSNTELPLPTQMLLDTVMHAGQWLPWVLGGLTGLSIAIYTWAKTPQGRETLDWSLLHLPFVGEAVLKSQIVRLSRTLATILSGGIPMLNALHITAKAMTNQVIAKALVRASDNVKDGMGLAASLKRGEFLPRMTLEMIEVGESTGSLETMLQEVAEFHEGELDLHLSKLTTWIEPVLLLIMGVLVGGIVIIMYLPVFQLAGTL